LANSDLSATAWCPSTVFTANLVGTGTIRADNTAGLTDDTGTITVVAGAATTFEVDAPATATAGTAFDVTVTARDAYTNVATGYTGTVQLTSGDAQATLPANYTFTAADAGIHTFTAGVTLGTAGDQTVTATDTTTPAFTDTDTVTVSAGAATQLKLEDAAAGGDEIGDETVTSGQTLTAYAITRDAYDNFVENAAATWSLTAITGGVVAGDLVPSADNKSATFTGAVGGSAIIQAVAGLLTDTTGTITVQGLPVVTDVSPDVGTLAGGNTVTITGFNLAGATSVTFGGVSATILTNTATEITATAPGPAAAGTVDVQVTTPGGFSSDTTGTSDDYTYASMQITGFVEGKNVDDETVLLEGALVQVTLGLSTVGTAFTDETGVYTIDVGLFAGTGLPIGSDIVVTASKEGQKFVAQFGEYDRPTVVCDFTNFSAQGTNRRLPYDDGNPGPTPFEFLMPNYITPLP